MLLFCAHAHERYAGHTVHLYLRAPMSLAVWFSCGGGGGVVEHEVSRRLIYILNKFYPESLVRHQRSSGQAVLGPGTAPIPVCQALASTRNQPT